MKRANHTPGRPGRWLRRGALLASLALPLTGCDVGEVLQVEDPDIVTPGSLTGAAGLDAFFAGAILDFQVAYGGGGGDDEGVILAGGMLADEFVHSGSFPTRIQFDRRSINTRNSSLRDFYTNLQRARAATVRSAARLSDAATEAGEPDPRVARLWALNGFTSVFFAETFCSGVPYSEVTPEGEFVYGEPLTTVQALESAIESFDRVLNDAAASQAVLNLARVGKARALVDLGRYEQAAQVAATVPTSFLAVVEHSANSGTQENGVFVMNSQNERWSVANDEGGDGPFLETLVEDGEGLSFIAAADPRVPVVLDPENGLGIGDVFPNYELLGYPAWDIVLSRGAPVPLATGVEARLIEAEAALVGNPARALTILNELRAAFPALALPPLTGPATVDLLFEERAFWLYATGHRLGDLRRLVRQYEVAPEVAFPSGTYFKGGTYGNDMNFPIPFEEGNNPNFSQCLDRNA